MGGSALLRRSFNAEANTISLVNISENHNSEDSLVVQVPQGENSIGTLKENKIVIKGLGMAEKHAVLSYVLIN